MRQVYFAFLAAGLLCFCRPQAPAADSGLSEYTADGAMFSVRLPAAWSRSEALTARRQLRQYGVDAVGPGDNAGGYPRISVMYYAKGHKQFRTPEKYVAMNSRPSGFSPLKGEKFTAVGNARAAGRAAKKIEALRVEFLPPHGAKPKRVSFFQRQLVLPGRSGGFYVLEYYAPLDAAKKYLPLFEAVVGTFKPNM